MTHATAVEPERDRGVVDVSIEMLFGLLAVVMVLLLLFETAAYWHARNVFDEAASEGARIAAAYDGSCAAGIDAARASIARQAGGWADDVEITCVDGATVTVAVTGRTPGVVSGTLGFRARVEESA
ncbi:MAG: TadE/TadG family type IV pilus assembly protein, partial [Ilumatobacteraceae bacterium]